MADGQNPFQSLLNSNIGRTGLFDMRMMSAANRAEPGAHMPHMYGHQGISGNPMLASMAGMSNEPDYSQFTYDPVMRQRAIAAGVSPLEANQVKQNAILPNTGFFGNHPRLSGALEGGIFGALASHGGMTPGDSIQGALEGMVGGQQMRQGMLRQQFARPFEAASMLEGLQDRTQKRDLQEAEIQHYRAENQKLGRPDHDMRAIGNAGPQDKFIPVYDNTTGQFQNQPNPNYDPALVSHGREQQDLDIGTREQLRIMGVAPNTATTDQLAEANKKSQAQAVARIGAGAGARSGAEQPYKNLQDAQRQHDEYIRGLNGKILKSDDPQHLESARQTLVMERMAQGNFSMPSDADVKGYIKQNNDQIQQQISGANAEFSNQYPQALETPGRKNTPSLKNGVRDYTQLH